MESSGLCEHNEPKVGILLDLGSPFNSAVQPDNDTPATDVMTSEELDNKPVASDHACLTEGSQLPSKEETAGKEDEESTKSSRSSQDSGSLQESPNWTDLADEHLIDSEKFDFDLPVSPVECIKTVAVDDEDEVFFGPVGFTETCVAKKTQLISQSPTDCKPLSPLNVEQYLELFMEANKVAMELVKIDHSSNSSQDDDTTKHKETAEGTSQKSHSGVVKRDHSRNSSQDDDTTKHKETAEGTSQKSHSGDNSDTKSTANTVNEDVNDSLTKLPQKPESRNFKRLIRKEMRSPRRGTYTIAVSPSGTPPPKHLPSADKCVSILAKDKPKTMQFTAAVSKELQKTSQRESKLPVKGLRKSKLPMTAGLKKTGLPLPPSTGTSTDKLLRKKISSPPKRIRLSSCESEDISDTCSSVASESFETPILNTGIPKGKHPQPGSFHSKGASGVRSSGNRGTPTVPSIKAPATSGSKVPMTKPSLLHQGSLQRRTVHANGSLKLVKPGQQGSLSLTKKPQPLKAVAALAKVPSTDDNVNKATPKKTSAAVSSRQSPLLQSRTPSTPVHQAKKVLPKRLLSSDMSASKSATRSLSTSAVPTPQSKLPPSTPSRPDSKLVPASTGSIRRRSGIPTPARQPVTSTSRDSTSSTISHPSPMPFRTQRTSTTTSSPSTTPHPLKRITASNKGAAIKLDLDCSPVSTKQTKPVSGRLVLETKTNSHEVDRGSPDVGVLIDLSQDTPGNKLPKASVTQGNTRNNKENLIDLL